MRVPQQSLEEIVMTYIKEHGEEEAEFKDVLLAGYIEGE